MHQSMERIVAFSEVTIRLGLMVGMETESDICFYWIGLLRTHSRLDGEKWAPPAVKAVSDSLSDWLIGEKAQRNSAAFGAGVSGRRSKTKIPTSGKIRQKWGTRFPPIERALPMAQPGMGLRR